MMAHKYKLIFFFLGILLLSQFFHILIFVLLKYVIILSYDAESSVLIYSFQLILLGLIVFLIKRFKINKLEFGLVIPSLPIVYSSFFLLVFTFVISFFVGNIFTQNFLEISSIFFKFDFPTKNNLYNNIHPMLAAIILAPFLEEVLYRLIIFKELFKRFNLLGSIVLTSFLFSFMHSDLEGFFSYFLVGVVLTYLYSITNNLWLNIGFHSIFNIFTFLTIQTTYEGQDVFYFLIPFIYIFSAIGVFYCF